SQDMVLGIYYLTQERPGAKGEGSVFSSVNEAILAYENGYVTLHSRVKTRVRKQLENGEILSAIVDTTVGRLLFNEIIPQDLGFVDRTVPGQELRPEIDFLVKKGELKSILERVMSLHGPTVTAVTLDNIKDIGYKFSTRAAMTVSIDDMVVPEKKQELMDEAQKTVDQIARDKAKGLITEDERYKEVIETWRQTDDELTSEVLKGLGDYNNLRMMADSGARGSKNQIKQLAGMRGLMADTTGHTIELPIKSNFREGLDILEYFISAHGARKGLSDTALRTADSGYLTRRLVDVSQDLIIREDDCAKNRDRIPYMEIRAFGEGQEVIESLKERITGRVLAEDVIDPETGEIVIKANRMATSLNAGAIVKALEKAGRESVKIRTVLTCKSKVGVCAKCYGANMATTLPVQAGEAVGIIAAQSIGEPGTQLTMRNFHTGGVSTNQDITQGLPRVEELFEARKPKGLAIISEIAGTVTYKDSKKKREIIVTDDESGQQKTYLIPWGSRLKVFDGDVIEAGDEITEGSVNPHDL
ncbi:MAG: DNA-directed RNA polymerase subunit beta', partial [Lachnospiraceae bacterium]|nr:DNA-directed RNA polymerase subunit beta' [Lachnospiraceae bacterium]